MGDVKIPFGVNGSGRLVGAETVARGAACECTCPGCAEPLVAAKGDILRHHFRHTSMASCAGALETSLHKFAKQTICEHRNLLLPKFGAWEFDYGVAHTATPEFRLFDGSVVADVLLEYGEETIAVEIFVAHEVGKEKVAKYASNGHAAMEIDLSSVRWKDASEDEWRSIILRKAFRRWLVLPKKARDWLETKRKDELEKKQNEIEEAKRKMLEFESKRVASEEWLRTIDEDRNRRVFEAQAERNLNEAEQREREARNEVGVLLDELEKKRREAVGAEMRQAVQDQLRVERRPPDMQKMVEEYGGYHLIPEEAWTAYHRAMEIWHAKHRSGAFYDGDYRWLKAAE